MMTWHGPIPTGRRCTCPTKRSTIPSSSTWLNGQPGARVAGDGQLGPATYRAWAYAIITLY